MSKEKHICILGISVGDEWNDGHGMYEKIYVSSSRTMKEIMEAYLKSVETYKFAFDSEDGYIFKDKIPLKEFTYICTNYDDSALPDNFLEFIKEMEERFPIGNFVSYPDAPLEEGAEDFAMIFLWFAALSLKDRELADFKVYNLLNVQECSVNMGYGLFV
jgi:hypothetical protein